MAEHELLTLREAAEYLRLAPRTLYQRRYLGLPPAGYKLGGRVVFKRSELDEYVNASRDPEPVR